ncbi:UNVERIFIED_CONTAM: hypothetical protein GTU68_055213 [Idotea baltica]|nr:hypothetical protein [Idotea baltica]
MVDKDNIAGLLHNASKKNEFLEESKSSKLGLYLAGITGGAAIVLCAITLPFVSPAIRKICLPYVPATDEQVLNVLRALKGRSGKVIDIGSGDGRIVVAVARNKRLHSTGVELNPWLVWYSKIFSWSKGLSQNTSFIRKDLWKFDLSPFQNVVIFGVDEMMDDLQKKLVTELGENSCVIACRFPLPAWKPVATFGEGINTVWLYHKNSLN